MKIKAGRKWIPHLVVLLLCVFALLWTVMTWKNAAAEENTATEENAATVGNAAAEENTTPEITASIPEDGSYLVEVALSGGTGRASVLSPALLTVSEGTAVVRLEWSSSSYDYMKLKDVVYEPVNTGGNSVFELPVAALDEELKVIADTTAMSVPHEITYVIRLDSSTLQPADENSMAMPAAASGNGEQDRQGEPDGQGTPDGQGEPDGLSQNRYISARLTYERSMELSYATGFSVDYYSDGFILVSTSDGMFLLNTENRELPDDLEEGIVTLAWPVENIYLAASAAMDMFVSMDALDHICLSGIREDGWYIEEAREAMETGKLAYAGKYNAPDYERILSGDCRLAVESTMILHAPDVKESLERLGIPVFVDRASYEEHPLGRTEWVRLYGVLVGKEEEAEAAFREQEKYFLQLGEMKPLGKTVVFFYISSNGTAVVRKSGDYVSKMIELAGGTCLIQEPGEEEGASSGINMQMEEFYARAKDADYLIYNSTVDGSVSHISGLLEKSELLADFKAVKEGNVWCTSRSMYQESMSTGKMIRDIHRALTGEDMVQEGEAEYGGEAEHEEEAWLYRLEP